MFKGLRWAGLMIGLGLSVTGCADGYGYSGVSVGAGGGYAAPYYGGYGYGGFPGYAGGPGYFGWYDNFYYPGTGIYVYDRARRRYRWNDGQRRYWEGRRGAFRGNGRIRQNWSDFRRDIRRERRDYRSDLRDGRRAYRARTIDREQLPQSRRDARREYRRDVRRDYRQLQRDNRAYRQSGPPRVRYGRLGRPAAAPSQR